MTTQQEQADRKRIRGSMAAETRAEVLRLMEKYGDHLPHCPAIVAGSRQPCTCGYSTALRHLREGLK